MISRMILGSVLLLTAIVAEPQPARAVSGTALVVQGWSWNSVREHMGRIKSIGYSAILLSPHTATCSGAFGGQGYDPSDFTSFSSGFGSEQDLRNLIHSAHAHGLQIYANMIFNHMCARPDYNYRFFSRKDFHQYGQIQNWSDPWELENKDMFGLHDLNQDSPYVRGQLWNYLVKTNNMGFDGYRLDGVKHVPYWYWAEHIVNNMRSWGKFVVGEVYDANLNMKQHYAHTGMAVTDYNLYFKMRDAFRYGGDLSTLDGAGFAMKNGGASVTFVENHDVGPPENRLLAYAFITGYPGYPFFANQNLNDHKYANLVWIHANKAYGRYLSRWSERDVLLFEREGHLLVGINQSHEWQSRWVDTSWTSTRLHDFSGHAGGIETANDRRVLVSIPPMSYVMYAP